MIKKLKDNKFLKGFLSLMKNLIIILVIIGVIGIVVTIILNGIMMKSVSKSIITEKEALTLSDVDCILVLGAGVKSNGKPSGMLSDRIDQGISLYEKKASEKIIMSGDHGTIYYDEVNCMKNVAIEKGVPSSAIFMDHAGFSTYDSMYRAKYIFGVKKIIIVTQDYHMYRAIYDAKKIGIEAYGVTSNPRKYGGQWHREIREVLARVKDMMKCVRLPESSILGESISLEYSGDVTNDK